MYRSSGLSAALNAWRRPARLALVAGYLHLMLLAGNLARTAGNEMIILGASGRT